MRHARKPKPVALVPYAAPDGDIMPDCRNLLTVAAALNIQAQRDLAPAWNTRVIVSPFLALEDVPPGYGMVVIVPDTDDFKGPKGFHFLDSDTSIAVVRYGPDWSLDASHELMEMLVDPRGDRTARGPSIADGQGWVDYLVEVCDPCQHSTYTVDGVLVSDFVTPAYYTGAPSGTDALYSYTGRVPAPRAVLDGGYITWATQPPRSQIWQGIAPAGTSAVPGVAKVTTGPLSVAHLERAWIDVHPPTTVTRPGVSSDLDNGEPLTSAQAAYINAASDAHRNGGQARQLIANVLEAAANRFSLDLTRDQLDLLRTDDGQAEFLASPKDALERLTGGKAQVPSSFALPTTLPPPERYQEALNAFALPNRFGTDLCGTDLPGLFTWMCQLGGF